MSAESVVYYLNRPEREPVEDTEWLFSALGQFTGAELRELLGFGRGKEFRRRATDRAGAHRDVVFIDQDLVKRFPRIKAGDGVRGESRSGAQRASADERHEASPTHVPPDHYE